MRFGEALGGTMALRADDVDLGRDRNLVEQFQAGNPDAFDDLYRRYFERLYRFCLKRVGDRHEAEEVTQEAFARAYVNLNRFDGDRRFYPWVTVIAGRLCVDTYRRRARSTPSEQIDLGAVEGGQEAVIHRVDTALLNQALARLAPRHREVLELRERQGMSYQSIADQFDVSLGTVEALLWRARRALRREFLALADGELGVAVGGLAAAYRAGLGHPGGRAGLGGAGGGDVGRAGVGVGAETRSKTGALRRWTLARHRLAVWAHNHLPSLQPLASGVAAAGVGVLLLGSSGAPAPAFAVVAPPGHVATVSTAGVTTPTDRAGVRAVPGPHAAAHVPSTSSAPTPGATPRLARIQVLDGQQARSRVDSQPVHTWVGGVGVGVDPQELLTQAKNLAQGGSHR